MEIIVQEKVINTVCNSLRTCKQSLRVQLARATEENKKETLESQLAEVEEALSVFDQVQ